MSKVRISKQQLVAILQQLKGVTFCNVTYFVDESKSRQIKGVKQVQKLVNVNLTLGSNYENKVNKIANVKQGMEINFVADEMKGKTMIAPALLKSDKDGQFMLYGAIEHNAKRKTTYFHEGLPRTIDELKTLDVLSPSFFVKPDTKGRGVVKTENDFALISPKIDTIKDIKIGKIEYEIL